MIYSSAPRNLKRELDGVLNAVKSGKLSEELITEKCRKVLTYKYVLGLKNKPHVQLSGLEKRLNRPETKELILRLQKAAITVPANVSGILPFDSKLKGTVVLNIGKTPGAGLLRFPIIVCKIHSLSHALLLVRI